MVWDALIAWWRRIRHKKSKCCQSKKVKTYIEKGYGTLKINEAYAKAHPNNCPLIEEDGDGRSCGTCTFYLEDGVCPRHGRVRNGRR